jgi:hypothetical protein
MPVYKASDPAVTQRPPSSALLAIDSEDRFASYTESRRTATYVPGTGIVATNIANTSPYDFQITRAESLMNGFISRVAVSEVTFPWAIPNINVKTYQIRVSYEVSGGAIVPTPCSLNIGFSNPASIAAQLQAFIRGLDASLAAATFTYGANSNLNFTYDTGSTTTINFTPLPYNSSEYPYPDTTKQLFDLLGFTNANTALQTGGFGNYTLCQSIRYVDFCCPELTYNQALKDTMSQKVARDSLCRLYLGDGGNSPESSIDPGFSTFSPPGCVPATLYRNFAVPKYIQWLGNQPIPGTLRFTVYDDTGAPLTEILEGGALTGEYLDWSMTLLVSEN